MAIIDDAAGKRVWVYPRKPQGRLYRLREGVAVLLLTLLFGAPFVRVDGHPLFLLTCSSGSSCCSAIRSSRRTFTCSGWR
jgi:hypothetical protein